MTVAYGAIGGYSQQVVNTLSLGYPTGITVGQLLIAMIASKYPPATPPLPSGWIAPANNQYQGGAGAPGLDSGQTFITLFLKEALGSESGALDVDMTGHNTSVGRIVRCTKDAALVWSYGAAGGADNNAGTTWSVTMDVNPAIQAGDLILTAASTQIGEGTTGFSSPAMSAAGISAWGAITERADDVTNVGDDLGFACWSGSVTTGTATGVATFTATHGSAVAGATVILRLRDVVASATGVVTGALVAPTGEAIAGAVLIFTPLVAPHTILTTDLGGIAYPAAVTAVTAADGSFTATLLRADKVSPRGLRYRVEGPTFTTIINAPSADSTPLRSLLV